MKINNAYNISRDSFRENSIEYDSFTIFIECLLLNIIKINRIN